MVTMLANTTTMVVCSANATISAFWENGEFATCVSDLFGASLSLAFILSYAVPKLWYQQDVSNKGQLEGELPVSRMFQTQVGLNAAMTALGLLKALANIIISGETKDHVALVAVNSLISWPVVVAMLLKERRTRLSNQGHTFALRVFWIGSFVYSNVALFSLLEPKTLESGSRLVLALGVTEYVVSGLVYWMGYQAVGLEAAPEDPKKTKDFEDQLRMNPSQQSAMHVQQMGWDLSGWGPRIKTLTEVVWGNRTSVIKLNLAVCVLMMLIQRVLNVFQPLYESYLFNSMSIGKYRPEVSAAGGSGVPPRTGTEGGEDMVSLALKEVRWDYIFISAGLRAAGMLVTEVKNLFWKEFHSRFSLCLEFQYVRKIHFLSLRWHLSNRKTGIMSRNNMMSIPTASAPVCRGAGSVCEIIFYIIFRFIPTIIDVAVTIGLFATSVSFRFGLVVVFATFLYEIGKQIYYKFVYSYSGYSHEEYWKHHQHRRIIQNRIKQSIDNFELMKCCTNEQFEIDRYELETLNHLKDSTKAESRRIGRSAATSMFGDVSRCVGTSVVVMAVTSSGLTFGDYYLLTSHFQRLRISFENFQTSYRALLRDFWELDHLVKILKDESEVKDVEGAEDLKLDAGTIEFRNVSFEYLSGSPVLKNISFVAPGGSSLAIVGQSGSGKTTLMKLLMRFYNVNSGQILIDGQDISEVTQLSLRKNMGIVPQETVLFDGESISTNIWYANTAAKATPEATSSSIVEAAKNAQIHTKIMSLPQRYQTRIGGVQAIQLSGGEKQRIGIARVFLRNPKIVLLDEATSALDTRTERQIQTSLHQLCENRTSITVAHRLSTIINADKILVLSPEGTLAEQGTHDELMAKDGLYADMWNAQLQPITKASGDKTPHQDSL